MELVQQLEALLFYLGEPEKPAKLAKLLQVSVDELEGALAELEKNLETRGICVVQVQGQISLRTAPGAAELIERLRKEELAKEIGRAGAETLAIICYRQNVTRADIDYIRGVNSAFILRNLLVRGLVERKQHESDSRKYIYQPSTELLAHLGITSLEALPEYHAVQASYQEALAAAPKSTGDDDA